MSSLKNDCIDIRNYFSQYHLTLDSFVIGDTLGTGTFGRVRLIQCNYNGKAKTCALKMLKKSEIIRLKQVEHIKDEKTILLKISNPYIVNLYAAFQDERYIHMLMEYVIGGELFSLLRREGRFENDVAKFYAAEIISALEYLHTLNIVYRDLKPENLLLDKHGHIKITDFGFAKVVEDRTWTLCGTPEYLAPEVIQSKGHNKGVDWWALGILIFEMLAGYPPFYDDNPFGIYQKILAGNVVFPKWIDADAKDLIKKLLTADRTKRYGCMKNGVEDIKQAPWFKDINWIDIAERKVPAPKQPEYANDYDTNNFDKYPDSEEYVASLSVKDREIFKDF